MNAPDKVGMTVNGQQTTLEHYLLNVADRPVPKEPTHFVVAEILNTDLSIKRVAVYFNPADTWKGHSQFESNSPKSVGMEIGENLLFLNKDHNTLAYSFWIAEIGTNRVVHKGWTYTCTKANL